MAPNHLEIRLLGELELLQGGKPVPLPASRKTRALLGYLVLAPGRHTRSRLCDLLWDGPADPRAALRWSLSKLRPLMDGGGGEKGAGDGPTRILADREHVELSPTDLVVDLLELRRLTGRDLGALDTETMEAASARFRGEVLEGLELDDSFGFSQWLAS